MITLTYRENMQDKTRLKRDFDSLRRRLGALGGFQYVAVAERQQRGAWHLHVAVKGRQIYRVLRSIWHSVVGVDNGNIHVRNPFKERGRKAILGSTSCRTIRRRLSKSRRANILKAAK
ncbi:hypothetical protein BX592_1043 [Paraburkholderia rhizosphaerae]|uniref:Replication-associated protein ORF2/G2P domain-containing protein n=1 Tax=Paraburkholderia rhizosphaerae TaxID=480658 RepID=A0A4R8LXB6_9BURK|nr:hypothetical protein BX592_1043 [Paraburkholderia rhizosphaerae]